MAEQWLRSNPRVALVGAVPLAVVALIGIVLAVGSLGHPQMGGVRFMGATLACASGIALILWWFLARLPRLSYRDGHLLVYLRLSRPIRVPVDAVECFFVGQGPDPMIGPLGKTPLETVNVVMRFAERATEWKQIEVHPLLGYWCDGYATIRGAWCERLSVELVNKLNGRLVNAKRDLGST